MQHSLTALARRISRMTAGWCGVWLVAVMLQVSCSADSDVYADDDATRETNVVNGSVTVGFPSVGLIKLTEGNTITTGTGTLISSNTVLTAAHVCADIKGKNAQFILTTGTYTITDCVWPNGYHPEVGYTYTNGRTQFDISVAYLDRAVTNVTPSVIRWTSPASGEPVWFVGYGRTSAGTNSDLQKRIAFNVVGSVYQDSNTPVWANRYHVGGVFGNTCFGDSGGPAFDFQGRIIGIGVTQDPGSWTIGTDQCLNGLGLQTRVDLFSSFINNAQSSAGTVTTTKLGFGQSCTKHEQCSGGVCATNPNGVRFCTEFCGTQNKCEQYGGWCTRTTDNYFICISTTTQSLR